MWYFIVYIMIMALCFCFVRTKNSPYLSLVTKMLASMGFVTMAVFAYFLRSSIFSAQNAFLILGTVIAMAGDIIIDMFNSYNIKNLMIIGMILFAMSLISYTISTMLMANYLEIGMNISHLCYALILTAVLAAIFIFGSKILNINMGNNALFVDIYICISSFTTIFAWIVTTLSPKLMTMAVGLTIFLVSDIIWGFVNFSSIKSNNFIKNAKRILYYIAQILICITLLKI